jgi:formylglycine-generating enzyme required for sulfatase activity
MPTTFTMGSTLSSNETPPHQVTLTGRFHMASTEVTNAQYMAALQWAYNEGHVTATTSSVRDALDGSTAELLDFDDSDCQISFSGDVFSTTNPDRPVVEVTWYGSIAYCDWLSLQEGLPRAYDHGTWSCNSGNPYTATGYRLPTEAEWEFACRAGTTTHFNTGDCLDAGTEANYVGSYPYTDCPSGPYLGRTADVGSYPANQWGLFDMHGNVYEWCNDWDGTYGGDETDPEGAVSGVSRVLRGGGWNKYAIYCRSANRSSNYPYNTGSSRGFRPVRSTF